MKQITSKIEIEDLVRDIPESVSYLMEKGIRCLRCGEPIWGTLESASKEKGFSDNDIENFVKDLNAIASGK
jgi:methionine synthase II (cobalamin-independent)